MHATITRQRFAVLFLAAGVPAACAEEEDGPAVAARAEGSSVAAVGLSLEVDDGVGVPITVKSGQSFFLDALDLRAEVASSVDEGIDGLDDGGDFESLPWAGAALRDSDFQILANSDGTFTRRRFYLGALWMRLPQVFILYQVDAAGRSRGTPQIYLAGTDTSPIPGAESFFVRRLRAIQWTDDCPASGDCSGASHFREEALVELRESLSPTQTFTIHPSATELRLFWSSNLRTYAIPVAREADPAFAYGLELDVEPIASTPPADAEGTYAPGSEITFQVTLRDGAGTRLHPEGELPTYNEVIFGENEAGIQYYRAFFDPSSLYWRRKHRERMFMAEIVGPAHRAQPIRSVLPLDALLSPDIDVQSVATPAVDGVFAQYRVFPTSHQLFGGAWSEPVPDTWAFTLPADAEPGTYLVTAKARRVYLGQDVAASVVVPIQVGQAEPTSATLGTGNCGSCHSGQKSLSNVLHALGDRATCAGCHTPLPFEHDAPIYVRLHYLHSRSPRYPAALSDCSSCHLTAASISRTSKSACLSCHGSYPANHVAAFGAIVSPYVGGREESFTQCTSACHTTHPGSHL